MDFHSLASISGVICLLAAIIVVAKMSRGPNLDPIPAVGSSCWLGSWWAGIKYITNARSVLQEGYEKASPYKSTPFKVAEPSRWTVILSNRDHVDELARASDEFSLAEALNDQIHLEHLLGPVIIRNPYHLTVIRLHLARNLEALYPDIRDELVASFTEVLDLRENEWKSVLALSVVQKVICRTSNRVFVGLPLCRDPDWMDLNIRCAAELIKGGFTVGLFPEFMRPLATRLFTNVTECLRRGVKHLGPIIEERQKYLNEHGTDWDDKPNDLLSWLMDEAKGSELTIQSLMCRVLLVNFAAIQTSASAFTRALLRLAANPQYIRPLREEVEGILEEDGWSKVALGKMRKVDSFLKECLRIEGTLASVTRKAMKDFTFSDGTFIPKGTSVAVASRPIHHNEDIYENPAVFDPFRFADTREEDVNGQRLKFTSTSSEFLGFGHGRHACPGRFFAAGELKMMFAHVVVTYDVKLEDGATYMSGGYIGPFLIPNGHAKVVFRNRVD